MDRTPKQEKKNQIQAQTLLSQLWARILCFSGENGKSFLEEEGRKHGSDLTACISYLVVVMELDWVPLTVTDSTRDVGSHCGLCLTCMRNKLLLVNSATWFVHMTTRACYFSICTQGLKIIKSNCQSVSNCLLKFAKRSCLQTLAEKEGGNPLEDLLFILRLYSLSLKG